ncbi:MAG TPA: 50S ribosomal protein L22 [Thermoproteota archaeon]|nr:50S ribosomal protein L22 [Thermoproteota archaeon]
MPKFGYSWEGQVPEKGVVRASLREVRVSRKHAREIAGWIKGSKISEARSMLERVVRGEVAVPFRRYNKKIPHRKGIGKFSSGRFPKKAAARFIDLIDNLEANAIDRGLDVDALRIVNASAHPGRKMLRYYPRAFGRSSPKIDELVHIELVASEVS